MADGFVSVMDTPEIRIPIGHVIRRNKDQVVVGNASLRSGSKTHIINSFAAHFAEVEVDPETGSVRVLRYVAVHDSGRIIHPEAARGQIIGGVVQGLGYALMEEIPVDPESGAPLTLNLDSFKIPNLVDIPPIEAVLIEHPDPVGPYGAKALGRTATRTRGRSHRQRRLRRHRRPHPRSSHHGGKGSPRSSTTDAVKCEPM